MSLNNILEVLPALASSPPALLAYIIVVLAWILWLFRRARSKDFIRALETLPKDQKGPFAERSGYRYDDLAQLSERDRLKLLTRRYLLFAFLATLVALALILLSWIRLRNSLSIFEQLEHNRMALEEKMASGNAALKSDIERVEQLLLQANSKEGTLDNPIRDPIRIQLAKETLSKAYRLAIKVAKMGATEQPRNNLKTITNTSSQLYWDREDRLLVVTWTRGDYFKGLLGSDYTLSYGDMWVTVFPDIKNFCTTTVIERGQVKLRLEQLLGLPPESGTDAFVEVWASPRDLFRPAPDPDISRQTSSSEFPKDVDPEHIAWYNKLRTLEQDYPTTWTGLGYTFDWGNPESDIGLSEFIIRKGATVRVHSVTPTESYCNSPLPALAR